MLRKAFARAPLDGEGAYLYGGRWSSPGTRLAYTSEHQSLAMLEYFVHLEAEEAPPDLVLVTAEIRDDLPIQRICSRGTSISLAALPGAVRTRADRR